MILQNKKKKKWKKQKAETQQFIYHFEPETDSSVATSV